MPENSRKKPVAKANKANKAKRATTTAKPKPLPGGNPRIPKGDGDAPVQTYIAAMPGWKRDIGRQIDALVGKVVPDARKAVRWNSPFYGVEGQGWFMSYQCFTKYVKVAFMRGSSLRPPPPIESSDERMRYFHIGEDGLGDDEAQLENWIRQAAAIPGDTFF